MGFFAGVLGLAWQRIRQRVSRWVCLATCGRLENLRWDSHHGEQARQSGKRCLELLLGQRRGFQRLLRHESMVATCAHGFAARPVVAGHIQCEARCRLSGYRHLARRSGDTHFPLPAGRRALCWFGRSRSRHAGRSIQSAIPLLAGDTSADGVTIRVVSSNPAPPPQSGRPSPSLSPLMPETP